MVAGGGFASVRCVPPRGALDMMSGARALILRCSGDGRSGYKLTLKTDANMVRISTRGPLPCLAPPHPRPLLAKGRTFESYLLSAHA